MKKLILILLLFVSITSYSQAKFSKFSIGLSGGMTNAFTGLVFGRVGSIPGFIPTRTFSTNKDNSFGGSVDYYFSPFISAGITYDNVTLRDGTDTYNRAFVSKFTAIEIKGKFALGEFNDYTRTPFLYAIRNLNIQLGLGFVNGSNNVGDVGSGTFPSRQYDGDIGKSEFKGVLTVPSSIGYFINIYDAYQEPKIVLGFDLKTVYAFSRDIDGYNNDPAKFKSNLGDIYNVANFSIKFLLGPKGLYFR